MKTVFIRKIGMHPWEQRHSSEDENFLTITLINQDYESVWKTWCEFGSSLTESWPKIVQWHTKLVPYFSKTQEYLTQKKFSNGSNPGDILKKNESTGIYSQVISLCSDPFKIDSSRMAGYLTSITLMQKQGSGNESTWGRLSKLRDISTIDDIKSTLADNRSISFRFYDAETYGAAQLICHSEHLLFLNSIIQEMDINEIQQEDIYTYIHS